MLLIKEKRCVIIIRYDFQIYLNISSFDLVESLDSTRSQSQIRIHIGRYIPCRLISQVYIQVSTLLNPRRQDISCLHHTGDTDLGMLKQYAHTNVYEGQLTEDLYVLYCKCKQ